MPQPLWRCVQTAVVQEDPAAARRLEPCESPSGFPLWHGRAPVRGGRAWGALGSIRAVAKPVGMAYTPWHSLPVHSRRAPTLAGAGSQPTLIAPRPGRPTILGHLCEAS